MESNKEIRSIVINCLENVGILVDPSMTTDVNLTEYEMDSVSFISFVVKLEEELCITIPDEFLLFDILKSLNGFIYLVEQLKSEIE